jgi:hypothetical protein
LIVVAGKVAIGASGAVGVRNGIGFSVTRTGAGLYTIKFDSAGGVPDILWFDTNIVFATGGSTNQSFELTLTKATATATIQTTTSAAPTVAADPPSGSFLEVFAVIQNSSSVG